MLLETETTTKETRLSVEHLVASLYSERIADDTKTGNAEMYKTNSDARALYFKGVHDAIMCIEEWVNMGIPPNTLAMFLEAMYTQSSEAASAH